MKVKTARVKLGLNYDVELVHKKKITGCFKTPHAMNLSAACDRPKQLIYLILFTMTECWWNKMLLGHPTVCDWLY
jgi:hypothetical protein